MSENYPVDTSELRQQGTRGVLSTGAGIGLWVVNGLLHVPVLKWVLGGALVVFGIMGLLGKERADKTTGTVLLVSGVAGLASLVAPGVSSYLLGIGGVALLGYGIVNLVKFIRGLKSRS